MLDNKPKTPNNLAKGINYAEYIQDDNAIWVYDLPQTTLDIL